MTETQTTSEIPVAVASDPADPIAAVTHPDPYPYYRHLAALRPLECDERLGVWVAASADAVTAVLASDLCSVRPAEQPVPPPLVGSPAGEVFGRLVRMTDGDRHAPLKRAVQSALSALEPRHVDAAVREEVRALLAELDALHDRAHLDELVFRLPVRTVAHLLGVSGERIAAAGRAGTDVAAAFAPTADAERAGRGAAAAAALMELLLPLAEDGPGLVTALTRAARENGVEDLQTVVANAVGFLFQSCETTAGLLASTLLALARHPEVAAGVRSDPPHLAAVVAEVLRFDPPVQNTRRFVAADGIVAGRAMRRGDSVLVLLAAANRDPVAHRDADRFDPSRPALPHLAFGAGVHACPGQGLAATIARVAVHELLAAGLDPAPLAEHVTYFPSANTRLPRFGM